MSSVRKTALFPIFMTVFIDLIGVGIVIPVLPFLFLSSNSSFAAAGWSLDTRYLFIGLVAAVYPVMQFFGAPYLGALSDRWGRKPVLLLSLAGTFIGYLFFALAIKWHALWLLFVSRGLAGFTGGNISTAQSAIADVSTEETKAGDFGLIGIAYASGFILGPYIGGKLTGIFSPAAPFWFAAGLTLVNIVLTAWKFRETLRRRLVSRMSLLTGIENLAKAFRLVNLRTMFIVIFLFTLGFNFFTQFYQVLAIEKYGFTPTTVGTMFAYIGIWTVLVQGVLTRIAARRWRPEQIVGPALFLWTLTLVSLTIPREAWMLYLLTPFMALAVGLAQPNSTAVISNLADPRSQGEVLGINQSVNALAMALPPIIAGVIARFNVYLPTVVAAFFVFVSWLVFVFIFRRRREQIFHEV